VLLPSLRYAHLVSPMRHKRRLIAAPVSERSRASLTLPPLELFPNSLGSS
jgi:hypothetical protein